MTAVTDFDGVQRVTGEDKANPSEPPGEEVLQGADRLRLLGHFDSWFCRKTTNQHTSVELTPKLIRCNRRHTRRDVRARNDVLPGRLRLSAVLVFVPAALRTFHPLIYNDLSDSHSAPLRYDTV